MSTYEYKCDICGLEKDVNYPFAQAPQTHLCECGSEMRKVFGKSSVVFKGYGWAGKGRII